MPTLSEPPVRDFSCASTTIVRPKPTAPTTPRTAVIRPRPETHAASSHGHTTLIRPSRPDLPVTATSETVLVRPTEAEAQSAVEPAADTQTVPTGATVPDGFALSPVRYGAHPSISVVIPCRNDAACLAEALRSVFAQTLPPCEIIVGDDGTDGDTAKVVASFAPFVTLHRTGGVGVTRVRQELLLRARGEWILFLDADNQIPPAFLEKAVERIETSADPRLAYVYPDWQCFGLSNRLVQWPEFSFAALRAGELADLNALFRTAVLQRFGLDTSLPDAIVDHDVMLTLGEDGYSGVRLAETPLRYRLRADGHAARAAAEFRQMEQADLLVRKHLSFFLAEEANAFLRRARRAKARALLDVRFAQHVLNGRNFRAIREFSGALRLCPLAATRRHWHLFFDALGCLLTGNIFIRHAPERPPRRAAVWRRALGSTAHHLRNGGIRLRWLCTHLFRKTAFNPPVLWIVADLLDNATDEAALRTRRAVATQFGGLRARFLEPGTEQTPEPAEPAAQEDPFLLTEKPSAEGAKRTHRIRRALRPCDYILCLRPGDVIYPDTASRFLQTCLRAKSPEVLLFDHALRRADGHGEPLLLPPVPRDERPWNLDVLQSSYALRADTLLPAESPDASALAALLAQPDAAQRCDAALIAATGFGWTPQVLTERRLPCPGHAGATPLPRSDAAAPADVVGILPLSGATLDDVRKCVTSLQAQTPSLRFVLAEDGSVAAEDLSALRKAGHSVVPAGLGSTLGARLQAAAQRALSLGNEARERPHLLFLDPAIRVPEGASDWLTLLTETLHDADIGVAAPLLEDGCGTLHQGGYALLKRRREVEAHPLWAQRTALPFWARRRREVSAVSGAAMLVSAAAFEAAGGFDETLDGDAVAVAFCLRVRTRGCRILLRPSARLTLTGARPAGIVRLPAEKTCLPDPFIHPGWLR